MHLLKRQPENKAVTICMLERLGKCKANFIRMKKFEIKPYPDYVYYHNRSYTCQNVLNEVEFWIYYCEVLYCQRWLNLKCIYKKSCVISVREYGEGVNITWKNPARYWSEACQKYRLQFDCFFRTVINYDFKNSFCYRWLVRKYSSPGSRTVRTNVTLNLQGNETKRKKP